MCRVQQRCTCKRHTESMFYSKNSLQYRIWSEKERKKKKKKTQNDSLLKATVLHGETECRALFVVCYNFQILYSKKKITEPLSRFNFGFCCFFHLLTSHLCSLHLVVGSSKVTFKSLLDWCILSSTERNVLLVYQMHLHDRQHFPSPSHYFM